MATIPNGLFGVIARKNSAASVDLTTGLIHWWDMDGGTGWADDVGSWTLTEGGSVTDSATGAPDGGSCAELNANGDSLSTGNKTTIENISYSSWVYATTITGRESRIFSWRNGGTSEKCDFYIGTDGKVVAITFDEDEATSTCTGTTVLSTSTWYHVVVTDDGTTRTLYVNGSSEDTDTTSIGTRTTFGTKTGFGAYAPGLTNTNASLLGRLGMSGMWNIALDSDQVTALYNSGSGLRYADL